MLRNNIFNKIWYTNLSLVLILCACKNQSQETQSNQSQLSHFDQLSKSDFADLGTCDAIDIIMYNLPISMNHSDPSSISRSIGFISAAPVDKSVSCDAAGRVTYLSQGKILQEADFYLEEGCMYYGFYSDKGTIDYAHQMSEDGITFFNNIIEKVKASL